MEKLETLTLEQEELIPIIKQKWLDYFYKNKGINKEIVTKEIEWLYSFCKKSNPKILFCKSPLEVQLTIGILKEIVVGDNIRTNIGDTIGANIGDNIGDTIGANIWDTIGANIGANIGATIGANIWDNIGANIGDNYERPSYYNNLSDYGWLAFYDYFKTLEYFDYDWTNYSHLKTILENGVYEITTFENICFVCELPKVTQNNMLRLHNQQLPAVMFPDGFCMYFWNGINVSKKLILTPELITKEEILNITNAELRRCYMEKLGAKQYYKIAFNGVILLDEDIDDCGNKMYLWQSKEIDTIINKKIQFIEVTCPSTKRVYNIYPPNQQCTNVWEAKASTFNKKQNEFKPIYES